MSAGELEHEWAGTPGRLIRDRYRRAADHARVRGRMPCLIINGDLRLIWLLLCPNV